jgi:hypothetical protein
MNTRRSDLATWSLLIGLSAVVIFALAITAISEGRTPANSLAQVTASLPPSASDTSAPTPPNTPTSATPIPTEEPTPTDVPTPDEQATEHYIATVLVQKQEVFATWQQFLTQQPLPTQEPWPTSISDDQTVKAQLGKIGYEIENAWFGNVNGHNVSIYAGAFMENPAQGVLHVYVWIPNQSFEGDFLTPIQAGSVRIISGENYRLTLLSTDGTTFYFDIPGLQYVDSLTEIVPTITPYLTETPSATWTPGPTQTPIQTCTPGPTPTFAPQPPPYTCSD